MLKTVGDNMREIRLNIHEEIFEKFMNFVNNLPQGSVTIEEIDAVSSYPAITFEEAKKKVENSISNISKNSGKDADIVFKELLA